MNILNNDMTVSLAESYPNSQFAWFHGTVIQFTPVLTRMLSTHLFGGHLGSESIYLINFQTH